MNHEADPSHPLFGHRIAFTGDLGFMTRQEAFDRCAALGAEPHKSPKKSTTLLVMGEQDPRKLRGDKSAKLQRVLELREKGSQIEMITAREFFELLQVE